MTLQERLDAEWPLLEPTFDGVVIDFPGRVVTIRRHQLGPGWNLLETPILVEIPEGFPTTPPDNICVSADLRLANGAIPSNTMGTREIAGLMWLQFSYHIETCDWHPHADIGQSDTLTTYLLGALSRLDEAN